ncbi:hypothetical protein KIN20_033712 [Parelaphostrongylus tenuis]|uniref:Uncharacterized protein n=1 Tax=Parelaphostrongylus tenuis TaxID=148309 RepID=A0AAD5R936_PARTN|nr:hypothetical protein KIN20_033712 [Parelaphostrongylus tenuis]
MQSLTSRGCEVVPLTTCGHRAPHSQRHLLSFVEEHVNRSGRSEVLLRKKSGSAMTKNSTPAPLVVMKPKKVHSNVSEELHAILCELAEMDNILKKEDTSTLMTGAPPFPYLSVYYKGKHLGA